MSESELPKGLGCQVGKWHKTSGFQKHYVIRHFWATFQNQLVALRKKEIISNWARLLLSVIRCTKTKEVNKALLAVNTAAKGTMLVF